MASENTVLTKVINRKLKKCGFCNKELKPIGFDYLYENVSPDCIEYERCDCEKSKKYWAKKDKEDYLNMKREHYRKIINQLYKDMYIEVELKYDKENNRYIWYIPGTDNGEININLYEPRIINTDTIK